ncbi:hypothetical protein ILUMI_18253 [Ignelater luminosus]|uniref:Fas-binding factor 1 C-terminal domain-containing protein n=1 Tax=Ignelater luminosus TaxID=2038154 RepID=A0A8K0CQK5_IGNLU|nr:hypothetical protein ILUMI_18253 [Ignelater luminosus]
MRTTLEKSREAAETERAQLMALVRSLEMKLVEQTQNAKEERWALQQAAAVLAARSTAFDREIEFTRASLEREKEQSKTLKESMLAEQEKVMLHLTEEKLCVSAEKARLETAAKLNQNYDAQKARAEIDAAIQVAKEATELTDREREALHRQQSEAEILKRNLLDKEHKLALKENELHEMLKNAERKMQDGEKAIREAKTLEAKYNTRLKDIQGQLMSLMNREKKLAEEKISLSKERLSLHNSLRQVKKCSLCAADNLKPEESTFADDVVVEQDFSPRIYPVTDPDILRLRYEISEERSLNSKDGDENELKK